MKKINQLLAFVMAALMIAGVCCGTVYAEEAAPLYEAAEVYVLNYDGAQGGAKWQYFSPYMPAWVCNGRSDSNNCIAFTLCDTQNETRFPVYCTDVEVGLDSDSNFRRINLEDSTYAGFAAGKLRSVYLNGFPHTSLEALSAAAGVDGLTVGEAVAATQLAIWNTAHGSQMTVTDFCRSFDLQWSSNGVTEYFDECYAEIASDYASAENEPLIEEHAEQVFRYLTNLSPTAPAGAVASRSSFLKWDTALMEDPNGTYRLTVTATVDVTLNPGDGLTLTAMVGPCFATTALQNGVHEYTLTIENIPADAARGEITLAIDGIQSLADVYLFDAVGGRGESQSLIGYTANALPVHAQINANDRVLNIRKTADGVGLQNIFFDLYHVCSVEEYVRGEVILGTGVTELDGRAYFSAPTDEDIARYIRGLPFATVATDADGCASVHFGTANDGIYIVAERENPLTTGAISPFFVAIPGGSDAADTDCYEITVEPKNALIPEDVEIHKDVNQIGNDHDTHAVGEIHTWIIRASIPAGLATAQRYEIRDTLSEQLTFSGNVTVTVARQDAPAHEDLMELVEATDYALTVSDMVSDAGKPITAFSVSLTPSGMEKAAEADAPCEVRVYFDAYIDEDALLGSEIPNQAHIHYENNVGIAFDRDSDLPEVHTGGIALVKVDASNPDRKLAGARFTLNAKTEDGVYTPVEFFTDETLTQKSREAVTDENGCARFCGLAYGTYYLIETQAPEGYNLLPEPVEVVINAQSHLQTNAVVVSNSARFQLPDTGGIGTAVFTLGGAGLLGAAALVLLGGRKRR